jgi:hypothetical protein
MYETWEEGSHLKEYTYKYNGGTGKYERASGGGTYMYESWTDTLTGGTYQDKLVLPWYGSPVSASLRSASSTKSTSRR